MDLHDKSIVKKAKPVNQTGLTPLLQQYKDIKNQNPEAILLFRCGDFYETFFDDAVLVSEQLQIALTARGKTSDNPVPLAGVPYHSIDSYIARLVKKGFTVAICEQMEDPAKAKGLVKRDVVRIITPGTLTEPEMLEEKSNNYLVAIGQTSDNFCLAAVELSTGELMLCEGDNTDIGHLPDEFTRLMPREIICLGKQQPHSPPWKHINVEAKLADISTDDAISALSSIYTSQHRSRFKAMSPLKLKTTGILAEHLLDTQRCSLAHLRLPVEYRLCDGMVLDEATLKNLELLPDINTRETGGTLFDIINRTKTGMGARLLKRWLLKPLIEKEKIVKRQNKVEVLHTDALLLAQTREILKGTVDLERLLSRIVLGGKNPRDYVALKNSMKKVNPLKELLVEKLPGLSEELIVADKLIEMLEKYIKEDPGPNLAEGGVINDGISPELDELRSLLKDGSNWLKEFEESEKEKTKIKTLKVKKNSVFGYFIEISKSFTNMAPEHYTRKQTLTNAERYITAELKDYETKIFSAGDKMVAIEKQIFETVIEAVIEHRETIQQNAIIIAQTDAYCSLAQLAREKQYIKPEISTDSELIIEAGRHPVVEHFIESGSFNPNDLTLDNLRRQAIITGPNMAGKSTYLRQTALIVLLAQIGAFVPAKKAKIGIADRIFTRVGASDNLTRGQSTFMVEMMETSNILRNATSKSLLILDEIGRGTSTFDGLSLAWSILEHINKNLAARTLFATHYHEMTDLQELHKEVFNLNISVSHNEETGEMVFLHQINEGPANKSYGIEVACLAGLPQNITDRAREILFDLEKKEQQNISRMAKASAPKTRPVQLTLFNPSDELKQAILALNIEQMTPIEALNQLDKLRKLANER